MVIGFLHLGKPEHGVRRFGQLLAREAKRRPNLRLIEVELTLGGLPHQDLLQLADAARILSAAQIVQIQFTEEIWGHQHACWRNLRQFLSHCRAAVAVTIHDTEPPRGPGSKNSATSIHPFHLGKAVIQKWLQQARFKRKQWLYQAGYLNHWEPGNAWIRQWLIRHTQLSIVCTEEERQRLLGGRPKPQIVGIPHFIEQRAQLPSRAEARLALGVQNRQVVTLLGFIFGGKGHHLLLQALSLLPNPDLLVVFAGGVAPGSEGILADLTNLADRLNISDRLRITGYLEEADLEAYLMATDVPVCPFEICFASSSISTWMSAGRLVLAADLPQFQEYNQIEPGSVNLFAPYTAPALAMAIQAMLAQPAVGVAPAVQRLRDRLSLESTLDRHLEHYHRVKSRLRT